MADTRGGAKKFGRQHSESHGCFAGSTSSCSCLQVEATLGFHHLQAQVDPLSTKLEQLLFAQQEQLAFASSLQNLTLDVREAADTKLEQVMALQNRTLGRMLLIQGEHERALLAQERKLDRLVAAHNTTAGKFVKLGELSMVRVTKNVLPVQ